MTEPSNEATGTTSPTTVRFLATGDEAGSAPEDRPFRPDVEGMRAVAILLVVLFHADPGWMKGGFVGVDVFFVISGFVITGLLLRERRSTGKTAFMTFYARRARRILPAALLVIMVALIVTAAMASARTTRLVASDSRWAAVFLANFHLGKVDPNIFARHPKILVHYWSLAVEEQFYLFYPASSYWSSPSPEVVGTEASLPGIDRGDLDLVLHLGGDTPTQPCAGAGYDSTFARGLGVGRRLSGGVGHGPLSEASPSVGDGYHLDRSCRPPGHALSNMTVRTVYPGYAAAFPVLFTALVIAGGAAAPKWGAEILLRPFPLPVDWTLVIFLVPLANRHSRYRCRLCAYEIRAHRRRSGILFLPFLALGLAAATYFIVENPVRHSKRLARIPRATLIGAALLIASCVALTFAF